MTLLYSRNYIERDLYIIGYKDKYLQVYASSGMNPGRKGRILPFGGLAAPERATLSGENPGYIYKEVYFSGQWINHRKAPHTLALGIEQFLLDIEAFVSDKSPTFEPYDDIKSYKDLLPLAHEINSELEAAIGGLEPFDWLHLGPVEDSNYYPNPGLPDD